MNLEKELQVDGKRVQLITFNKEIAYLGKMGKLRENFCIGYINEKNSIIKKIEKAQIQQTTESGEKNSCQVGCPLSTCCMERVEATIQECEAIIYYLYKNPKALSLFMSNYTIWEIKVNSTGNLLNEFDAVWRKRMMMLPKDFDKAMTDLGIKYFKYHISCPFLVENLCIIHPVRPYTCAGYYVTSPKEYCSINTIGTLLNPRVHKPLPSKVFADNRFYYGKIKYPHLLMMPLAINKILENGYAFIEDEFGITNLHSKAIGDLPIKALSNKYPDL